MTPRRKPVHPAVSVCSRNGSSQVILGAHSRSRREPEKQVMSVEKQIPYPHYDEPTHKGDLKLLKAGALDGRSADVSVTGPPATWPPVWRAVATGGQAGCQCPGGLWEGLLGSQACRYFMISFFELFMLSSHS